MQKRDYMQNTYNPFSFSVMLKYEARGAQIWSRNNRSSGVRRILYVEPEERL